MIDFEANLPRLLTRLVEISLCQKCPQKIACGHHIMSLDDRHTGV